MIWEKSFEIPPISSGQKVLLVYGNGKQADLARIDTILNQEEVAYALRIRSEIQRNTWISCHITLRIMLGAYLETEPAKIVFMKNGFGKPLVKQSTLNFNISHTNSAFLLGFNPNGTIGVDLEHLSGSEDLASSAGYAFSPAETDYCGEEILTDHFLKIWTLKEAYLKAEGVGLADNLKTVNVYGDINNVIISNQLDQNTFRCPEGETASIVCRNLQCISYVWLQ